MPPSSSTTRSQKKRHPTLRQMSSSRLSDDEISNASQIMIERANSMASRAKEGEPLTTTELQDVINSLHNITPHLPQQQQQQHGSIADTNNNNIDWEELTKLLANIAHLSHKDWKITGYNSDKMGEILLPNNNDNNNNNSNNNGKEERRSYLSTCETLQHIFQRILHEGNWDGAVAHRSMKSSRSSSNSSNMKPWAVLVTGVNGIRKTTSIYQPWFANVLQEALIAPTTTAAKTDATANNDSEIPLDLLPTGENSFFRQLDHMIVTLCNEEFSLLYALTCAQLEDDGDNDSDDEQHPSKELISRYSNLKASIFSRYRTLSELLGVILLREAQASNINTMCETSGRDVAMFHYIDHFFPSRYNKLVLHFTINDLSHAKKSVDERMVREMRMGKEALESGDVINVIYSNLGGPYGSEVLEGVQADSDRVWNEIIMAGKNDDGGEDGGDEEEGTVGKDWYKASMQINAHSHKSWTIQAVRPDGSLGTEYAFGDPRTV